MIGWRPSSWLCQPDLWLAKHDLFTLDWYTSSELLPHHKLELGEHPPGFEPYKLRREWRVE